MSRPAGGRMGRVPRSLSIRHGRRSVRRYSRLIGWMKIVLPLGALSLIAAIFLTAREKGELSDLFTAEELARLGAGLRLESPRFAGATERGEAFVLRAEWAMPDGALPTRVELEKPEGEIRLSDGRSVAARADAGLLHREEGTLVLNGGVTIDSSDGYHLETELIRFDLKGKAATAPGRVSGTGPAGTIDAGSMRATAASSARGGSEIWFENRIRLVFIPAMDAK